MQPPPPRRSRLRCLALSAYSGTKCVFISPGRLSDIQAPTILCGPWCRLPRPGGSHRALLVSLLGALGATAAARWFSPLAARLCLPPHHRPPSNCALPKVQSCASPACMRPMGSLQLSHVLISQQQAAEHGSATDDWRREGRGWFRPWGCPVLLCPALPLPPPPPTSHPTGLHLQQRTAPA